MGVTQQAIETIDLSPENKATVKQLLNQYLPNTEVWAYGSRVKWTANTYSDLDLVAFTTAEQKTAFYNLKEAFEESNLPFRVDLFSWDEIPEQFHNNIKKEKIILSGGMGCQPMSKGEPPLSPETVNVTRQSEAENVVLRNKATNPTYDTSSEDWSEIELGEFIELKRGYDLPKKSRTEGFIPIVSSSGVSGSHGEFKVKAPGVVTGRYGTIGQVYYVEENFWPLNTTLYVNDFKQNAPLFVYYLLKTINYQAYSDKAAVPGINRNHIHKAKIFVPESAKEQHQIALKLWALDQKIKLNHQIIQTLEQMVQALFKIGVDQKAIQSLQVQFNPWVEYNGKTQEQKGFVLTRQIKITLETLIQYEDSIDTVLNLGISNINQFNSSNSQFNENYQAALSQALLNAKQRAANMAKVLDLKLGAVISITEQSFGQNTPMDFGMRQVQASASYQPGEMSTDATVKVLFALQNGS